MIRILIAEDSQVVADHLKGLLESEPTFIVVGVARNGIEAVAMAQNLKPDVITMDILMPKMDGVEATRQIMQKCPTRIVIVTGSTDEVESQPAFEAIKEGALTVLEKPRGHGHIDYDEIKANLLKTVRIMSSVKVVTRRPRGPSPLTPSKPKSTRSRIIAMGASTGGPAALSSVLKSLPATLPVPVVVVQHMTAGFGPAFAGWLSQECVLPVSIAEAGEKLRAGHIYLAPDGQHFGVSGDGSVQLAKSYRIKTYHRPSVNYLFETVAQTYHSRSIGVLLTGMGEDGALGLLEIKTAGGKTICQDEATSVVFGMPKTAIGMGAADTVLPLDKIARAITDTIGHNQYLPGEKINA